MKIRHKFYLLFALLILASGFSATLYYKSQQAKRSGSIKLSALETNVQFDFDKYGVPHIKAANELDAQKALGYIHAQDRLFQMEMLRRIGRGKLSEVAGPKTIKLDELFLNLDLASFAKKKAEQLKVEHPKVYKSAKAYIDGVNTYINLGPTPLDFSLMSITASPFKVEDMYIIMGYVSYSFDKAYKTDLFMSELQQALGDDYLADLYLDNKSRKMAENQLPLKLRKQFAAIDELLEGLPRFDGSNAWLISSEKSKTNAPIFANDTHIAISAPTVWWEARISYPGYDTHGYFMSGIPFPILGNSKSSAWGLTIFHKDNTDFFKEKTLASKVVERAGKKYPIHSEMMSIKVKGHKDYKFERSYTELGPLLRGAFTKRDSSYDLTLSWDYVNPRNNPLWGLYIIGHARNKDEIIAGIRPILCPSLNLFYADQQGTTMQTTTGRLKDYQGQNPSFVMDAPKKKSLSLYPFEKNPYFESDPKGVIYNANQQPYKGVDGYYDYPSRHTVIGNYFAKDRKFGVKDTMELQLSSQISYANKALSQIVPILEKSKKSLSPYQMDALEALKKWDGNAKKDSIEASIFYELLTMLGINIFNDELQNLDINHFMNTSVYLGSILNILANEESVWWDKTNTAFRETKKDIVVDSFIEATRALKLHFGRKIKHWQWKKFHKYAPQHPIGRKKPMDLVFNFKPSGVAGGLESPSGYRFLLKPGVKKIVGGAAVRRIIDFSNPNEFYSIIPGGQSANVFDKHYADQYELFLKGSYRKLKFSNKDKPVSTLTLTP